MDNIKNNSKKWHKHKSGEWHSHNMSHFAQCLIYKLKQRLFPNRIDMSFYQKLGEPFRDRLN